MHHRVVERHRTGDITALLSRGAVTFFCSAISHSLSIGEGNQPRRQRPNDHCRTYNICSRLGARIIHHHFDTSARCRKVSAARRWPMRGINTALLPRRNFIAEHASSGSCRLQTCVPAALGLSLHMPCTEACWTRVLLLSSREVKDALVAHGLWLSGTRAEQQGRLGIAECCPAPQASGLSVAAFVLSIIAMLISGGALAMSIIVCCRTSPAKLKEE